MIPRLCLSPLLCDDELIRHTTPAERAEAAAFNPRRRREWLTWRAVVRRTLEAPVSFVYDAAGAPQLVGSSLQLTVSHAADRVAVLLAERPCGLDLERLDRKFPQLADRYLSPAEQHLSDDLHFLAAAWCAKEALYKFSRDVRLSLLHDLRIERFERLPADAPAGLLVEGGTLRPYASLTARIGDGEPLHLTAARLGDEHMAVWTVEDSF